MAADDEVGKRLILHGADGALDDADGELRDLLLMFLSDLPLAPVLHTPTQTTLPSSPQDVLSVSVEVAAW
jgi:hypothetical protein